LQAAAQRELTESQPLIPTETVNVGPGETKDIPNPSSADYQIAKALWDSEVRQRAANKMLAILADYAIQTPTDAEEVKSFRLLMELQGVNLDHESDRQIWLWRILAPHSDDQIAIMACAIGQSVPSREVIESQKATFRGDVPVA
jgi:hypothetical protein